MQNKFKSELANRIAEKGRLWSPRQLGVLVAAIAACALIVGATALSLPITANGSGGSPITYVPLIAGESDYLVPAVDEYGEPTGELAYASTWDSTFSVMRTVNLKADTFDTPGAIYSKEYTKWSYTTAVKLQDVSMLPVNEDTGQIAAVHLSTLTIRGVTEATLYPVQWNFTVNGAWPELPRDSYVAFEQDFDAGTMTIDITLPEGYIAAGTEVVILVQFRAFMSWDSTEGFADVGFPEGFPPYVAPIEPVL
jgi:hypothetical protein